MSLQYCFMCDRMIDLDIDEHFEHFYTEEMKGGGDNETKRNM